MHTYSFVNVCARSATEMNPFYIIYTLIIHYFFLWNEIYGGDSKKSMFIKSIAVPLSKHFVTSIYFYEKSKHAMSNRRGVIN